MGSVDNILWIFGEKKQQDIILDQPYKTGILFSKLFWPTMRKNCSIDREKKINFEAECQEFRDH